MKCCVSTDVEIWTNWLTFEPDPDYSPDAGTALPSSISCKRSNMEFYYVGKISSIPIGHPSLTRGFTMVLFTASCRNTFVRGKCALPSALLVYNYCTHMNRWSTTYIQYSSITAHKWIDEAQRTFNIHLSSRRQEARLSQTDRTMLRVTEYFTKSLNVTENDILEKA